METLFDIERKAKRKRVGLTEAFNDMKETKAQQATWEEEILTEQQQARTTAGFQATTRSRSALRRKMISEKINYEQQLKQDLFRESVYDIVMEALLLDDDFKEMYSENIRELCYTTLDEMMSERNITLKSLGESSSVFVQDIVTLCEETAKDAADKVFDLSKVNKKADSKDVILNEKNKKAKLCEEDKDEFQARKDLETKTIADAVRDKVVNVIRREQEMAEVDEMEQEELDIETEDFESLDSRSEEELDELHADEMNSVNEGIDDDEYMDDEFDLPTIQESQAYKPNRLRRPGVLQESLFKSLQINIASKALKESSNLSESKMGNLMDMVLAEAITYYTLLETLHTARIVNFTPNEVRSLAKELVFRSKNK